MRLDAHKGDCDWNCYDAKRCRMVKDAVWVDDSDATWWRAVLRPPNLDVDTVQEERIKIYPSRKLVVFNEIDGVADEQDQVADVIAQPTEVTAQSKLGNEVELP